VAAVVEQVVIILAVEQAEQEVEDEAVKMLFPQGQTD
jgi:hypothetical protein